MSQSASTQVREADSLTAALRLNDREFATLRDLIESTLGIQISDAKRLMLETPTRNAWAASALVNRRPELAWRECLTAERLDWLMVSL